MLTSQLWCITWLVEFWVDDGIFLLNHAAKSFVSAALGRARQIHDLAIMLQVASEAAGTAMPSFTQKQTTLSDG